MKRHFYRLAGRRNVRIVYQVSALVTLCTSLLMTPARAAEGQAAIRGRIYISPSGEPEGDLVMRAADVDVIVLRGEGGFQGQLEGIRKSRQPAIAKQLRVVSQAQEEFLRSPAVSREEVEKRSGRLRQERAKLAELREAYQKEVSELMGKHTLAKTKTDSEGRFNFARVPKGQYFIHAHFEIVGMDIHYYWLVPVEVEEKKESEVSLNKLNANPLL